MTAADEARSRKTAGVNDDKPSAPKTTNTNRLDPTAQTFQRRNKRTVERRNKQPILHSPRTHTVH